MSMLGITHTTTLKTFIAIRSRRNEPIESRASTMMPECQRTGSVCPVRSCTLLSAAYPVSSDRSSISALVKLNNYRQMLSVPIA